MLSIMDGILMSIHFHNEILMLGLEGAEGGEKNTSLTQFFHRFSKRAQRYWYEILPDIYLRWSVARPWNKQQLTQPTKINRWILTDSLVSGPRSQLQL